MDSHESDFDRAIHLPRVLLQAVGLWPGKFCTWPNFVKPIALVIGLLLMAFILLPCILFIIFIEKTAGGRLRCLGPFSFFLVVTYKSFIFISKQSKIKRCIEAVRRNYELIQDSEQRIAVLKRSDFARKFTNMCVIFMFGSALPYVTMTPLVKEIVVGNETLKFLAYPAFYVIFDPQVNTHT